MNTSALSLFKKSHGVATHRYAMHARTGNGRQYPVCAYFNRITMKDGTPRSFTELVHEYSWEIMELRNKCAEGADELSACMALASANRIPWPADEPKRKAKP